MVKHSILRRRNSGKRSKDSCRTGHCSKGWSYLLSRNWLVNRPNDKSRENLSRSVTRSEQAVVNSTGDGTVSKTKYVLFFFKQKTAYEMALGIFLKHFIDVAEESSGAATPWLSS